MLNQYIHVFSLLLWMAVGVVIVAGVLHALWIVLRMGVAGTARARARIASSIVSGLGLSTAIALLALSQLRTWNAIGIFAATASLRTFVKFIEARALSRSDTTNA